MMFWITVETGVREIFSHKFRSFLSMLGIVLGVSSLIATLALTDGIERSSREFMANMGGIEMVKVVDKEISDENLDFWNLSPGRTLQDAEAIRRSAPLVTYVSPEFDEGMPVSVGGNLMRTRVRGVWPEYVEATDTQLAFGRTISDLDVERATRTVAIGASVAAEMWPYLSPEQTIGKQIFLRQTPFEVIGVFQLYEREKDKKDDEEQEARRAARGAGRSGWDPFRWKNEAVVIPITTMFYEFQSGKFPEDSIDTVRIKDLTFRVGDLNTFEAALAQVRSALNKTHRNVDDFGFDTREDWFDNMNAQISATRTSGGLIAGISLLVGGIGIANIMLASISERVREIGIRRAVGARGRDIFLQIIIESVSTALMGGLLGVFVGFGLIALIGYLAPSDSPPFVTAGSIILSVVFAAVAGVLSGIYPAMQASRLDPIQALRYE